MGNSKLQKLRERLMGELEGHTTDKPLDTATMESIYKLVESIKGIDTICAMEDYGDDGYSENRMPGNSYRGRYRGSYGRWPMSYDDAKFNMVHKLGDLMMCTENEHTKSVLRNAINELEQN